MKGNKNDSLQKSSMKIVMGKNKEQKRHNSEKTNNKMEQVWFQVSIAKPSMEAYNYSAKYLGG